MSAEALPLVQIGRDWRVHAACRNSDPRLFDYDPETDSEAKVEPARRVCAACPVRDTCLSYALTLPAEHDCVGIYGGLTPAERTDRRVRADERRRPDARPWAVATDPAFARISFDLATGIGVQAAAEALGVTSRTLQRAWKRHGVGPLRPGRMLRPDAAPNLVARALRALGWFDSESLRSVARDPEFAVSSFELAGEVGTIRAARDLGVSTSVMHSAWDRHELGRPRRPQHWTKRFMADRELVKQAFELARKQSILAAASAFQVSAPTLRRAFAHHGLGHPHAGLERSELRRRWSTEATDAPDHHNRQQRRGYRARLAATRRARGATR